jgi:hypothetical protein
MNDTHDASRRRFLAIGLGAVGFVAAACGMGEGRRDEEGKIIHVSGVLQSQEGNPDMSLDLTLAGPASALSGTGRSSFISSDPEKVTSSFSVWSCTGSLDGTRLKVTGLTALANFASILGSPVDSEVDLETGLCSWSMGPFLGGQPKMSSSGRVAVSTGNLKLITNGSMREGASGSGRM